MGKFQQAIIHNVESVVSRLLAPTVGRVWDIYSLILLKPIEKDFIPWTGVAIRPYTALTIVNDICINNRKFIVELGAGISTILIARVLQNRGQGMLISVEDNEEWAILMKNELRRRRLDEFCKIIYAPLEICEHALEKEMFWYSQAVIHQSILDNKIELLLVDGPRASRFDNRLARFPPLLILKPYLAESCSIYIDDIRRCGENIIVQKWSQLINCEIVNFPIKRNFSCLQRGHSYYSRP